MVEEDLGTCRDASPGSLLASVIVPAHNEAAVIERTLRPLADLAQRGVIELIVVCNGCSDDTAEVASSVTGTTVLNSEVPSKTHALNLGDDQANAWPRIYLDADIETTPKTVLAVAARLAKGPELAARPPARYDARGSSALVRWYFSARARVPSLHRGLWGAGFYAVSREGHTRIGRFPAVKGDDLWADRLFRPDEKCVVDTEPVVVRTPRTLNALLAITRRNVAGTREHSPDEASTPTQSRTVIELLGTIRGPVTARDAAAFILVAVLARLSRSKNRWERDDTSRS